MKMNVIKVIVAPVPIVLSLLIFSFSAAQAGEADSGKKQAFSSSDVQPGLIEDGLEPEINIQQFDNREVQEYSVNDRVYMVKITPAVGSPYYLVDPDGTGEMEYKRDTVGLEVNPPQWTLFRW
jgi:hypothetical protein